MSIISFLNITQTLHNKKFAVAYVKAAYGLLEAMRQAVFGVLYL